MGDWKLYSGSRFIGKQTSGQTSYQVEVEIKHTDLEHSVFCGYLHIAGLTEEYPKLTTFFESEIIGGKYSFLTNKWDATPEIDSKYWNKFPQYYRNSDDYLFMRWKEHFLVPDHKIKTITGASFTGFYYITYCKSKGMFHGYYYHNKKPDEAFTVESVIQLLHVRDRSFPTFEFN